MAQRNPPLMGTATQTWLLGGRGDEHESLLPNLEKKKRERKQDYVTMLAQCVPQNITPMGVCRQGAQMRTPSPWGMGPGQLSVYIDISSMGRARSALPVPAGGTEATPYTLIH